MAKKRQFFIFIFFAVIALKKTCDGKEDLLEVMRNSKQYMVQKDYCRGSKKKFSNGIVGQRH